MAWSLPLGVAMDAVIGDPRGWPHPVRAIGALTSATEKFLRTLLNRVGSNPIREKCAGIVLCLIVSIASTVAAWSFVEICDHLTPLCSLVGRALLIHFGLAARELAR